MTIPSTSEEMDSAIERLEQQIRVYKNLKDISRLNNADFDLAKIAYRVVETMESIEVLSSGLIRDPTIHLKAYGMIEKLITGRQEFVRLHILSDDFEGHFNEAIGNILQSIWRHVMIVWAKREIAYHSHDSLHRAAERHASAVILVCWLVASRDKRIEYECFIIREDGVS